MANGSTRAHEQNDSASREVVNREQLTHSATEAIQDGSSAQRQSMPLITLCREVTACSSRNSPQTASREVPLRSIANFYASVVHWILFLFLLAKDPVDRNRGNQGTVLHLVPPSTHLMGVYEVQYCVKCRSERYCPLVCNVAVNFER